jgi:uncharacterized membrane protein YhhN
VIAPILVTLVCVVAVAFLVIAEREHDVAGRFWWKPLAVGAFIAVPLVGGGLSDDSVDPTVARWVVAGLCLGALGDLALMFENHRGFMAGLVAFLLGHVAYVAAFTQVVPVGTWFGGAMLLLIPLVVATAVTILSWLWPDLGSLRYPVIAYVAVITTMLIGGLAASLRGGGATLGAIAFFLSDIAVARERFRGRDPWNRTIGLPVYFGAQLLFAWAVVPR